MDKKPPVISIQHGNPRPWSPVHPENLGRISTHDAPLDDSTSTHVAPLGDNYGPARAGSFYTPGVSNVMAGNLVNTIIVDDMTLLASGVGGRVRSDFVRDVLRQRGMDPDNLPKLSPVAAARVHNEFVKLLEAKRLEQDKKVWGGTLATAIQLGKDEEIVSMPSGTVRAPLGAVRSALDAMGLRAKFFEVDDVGKDKIVRRLERRLRENEKFRVEFQQKLTDARAARTELHRWLTRTWARGPLVLERPTSSWLRHLADYDQNNTEDAMIYHKYLNSDLQPIVVENDWGAQDLPESGEWHTPFQDCCWEFVISGVRVMALTLAHPDSDNMTLVYVYGKGGQWVSDDWDYFVAPGCEPVGKCMVKEGASYRLDDVVRLTFRCIRAACIMMDARVAERIVVPVPTHGRVDSRVVPVQHKLRDHYVVRLLRERRQTVHRARSAGAGLRSSAPQRGHWRQGTWVHYPDPDSGQVQYANDGGFFVSKTWRRWHFAGDPNNIIHKEYRL